MAARTVTLDVRLKPDTMSRTFRADVYSGLTATPKTLPPKWLYDDRGSALFDEFTRLPEYYPTRRERSILLARAGDIARLSGADTLIELGSGTSEKTRILLDALTHHDQLRRYVPFDVSMATLEHAAAAIADEHPGVEVEAIVGDFTTDLDPLPTGEKRLLVFLGGTIGNLLPAERTAFLHQVRDALAPGDTLLLGADLVKDPERLVAAYNDAAGVTAAFNLNILAILNRELGADFDLDAFEHVALFDEQREWIEMRLRARSPQTVHVEALDLTVRFAADEALHTEVSAKFRIDGIGAELEAASLPVVAHWTDPAGDFALLLSRRG